VALVPLGQFSLEMFLEKLKSCLIFCAPLPKELKSDHTFLGAIWRFYDQTVEKMNKEIAVIACTDLASRTFFSPMIASNYHNIQINFVYVRLFFVGVKDVDM
jgi:hypothetical protein